jgi:hypothetical protein
LYRFPDSPEASFKAGQIVDTPHIALTKLQRACEASGELYRMLRLTFVRDLFSMLQTARVAPREAFGMASVEHRTPAEASDIARKHGDVFGHRPDDRFLWKYLVFAICGAAVLVILIYVDPSLVLAFYAFVLIALVLFVGLLIGIVALFTQKFRRAAALLLAPLIIAVPFLFPVHPPEYRVFDLVRFYLNKTRYDTVIEQLPPAERSTKVIFFKWAVTGILDVASYYWLVYDESGEIAVPDEERSQAWKDRVDPEYRLVDPHCLTSTQHMSGHYYLVVMHCAGA